MKMVTLTIVATVALLFVSAFPSFAVDGLQISVQTTNATLTWPSTEGETFVVQYRRTLDSADLWQTLSSAWPAAAGTNVTSYVHFGIVQYPPAGSGGGTNGGGSPLGPEMMGGSGTASGSSPLAAEPMVMRADGSGSAAPLAIYPAGFDLSGFIIFNPATGEQVNGDGYTINPANSTPADDMQPMDVSADSTNQYTGFYRVLGVRLVSGLTNGMTASNYLNVVVRPEAGANSLDLLADGRSFPHQFVMLSPPFTNLDSVTFEDVDTAGLSNGVHTLQIVGEWFIPSETSAGGGFEQAYSQPVTIYVTNEISYPDWDGGAGDGWASFDLQSAHPDVDWEIDIYNYYDYLNWYYGYTNSVTPIHIATGSTTNGLIDYEWNLTDDSGNVRTNLDTDPAFFSFTYTSWTNDDGTTGAASRANGPQPDGRQLNEMQPDAGGNIRQAQHPNPIIQNDVWPSDGGYWVVAYQDVYRDAYDQDNLMASMFNGWVGMANAANPVFYQTPTSGTNAQTFPIRYNSYTNTAFIDTNSYYNLGTYYDDELFNAMLHDQRARNLYVFGHGGNASVAGLELTEVNAFWMHRYRFVWLDGCDTATGSWDKAFHINGPGIFSLAYYTAHHRRPALFVGTINEIPYDRLDSPSVNGVHYDGTVDPAIPNFRSNIIFDWELENATFTAAVQYSKDSTPAISPPISLNGAIYHVGDYMQYSGYDQIRWNEYNALNDLPW